VCVGGEGIQYFFWNVGDFKRERHIYLMQKTIISYRSDAVPYLTCWSGEFGDRLPENIRAC
jgi:hypothetical protein